MQLEMHLLIAVLPACFSWYCSLIPTLPCCWRGCSTDAWCRRSEWHAATGL